MTDTDEKPSNKKSLTLSPKTLTLKKGGEGVHVRQSFTHGRSKTVTVEVKKKRVILPGQQKTSGSSADGKPLSNTGLTPQQVEERLKALHGAMKTQVDEIERVRQEFLENQALQQEETLNQKPSQPEETSTETSTPIIEAEINPIVEIVFTKG